MELEWFDELPEDGRHRRDKDLLWRFRAELEAHPGQWAKYPRAYANPYVTTTNIKRGHVPVLAGCEARTVKKVVYVRYLPPDSSAADRATHAAENQEDRADND